MDRPRYWGSSSGPYRCRGTLQSSYAPHPQETEALALVWYDKILSLRDYVFYDPDTGINEAGPKSKHPEGTEVPDGYVAQMKGYVAWSNRVRGYGRAQEMDDYHEAGRRYSRIKRGIEEAEGDEEAEEYWREQFS